MQIKTKQFYDHIMPSFGLIEEKKELSCIYLAVRWRDQKILQWAVKGKVQTL